MQKRDELQYEEQGTQKSLLTESPNTPSNGDIMKRFSILEYYWYFA